jgi:large subunit ribosomal protein L4
MQLDIVNNENQKVGSFEVRDDVFGGRVKQDLVWESVVRANAGDRRGTHKTKNRANVSGSGKKPWRQKGKFRNGQVVIVDVLAPGEYKTKAAAALLERLGVAGKAVIIDVVPDDNVVRSVRNLPGVSLVASGRVTAREVVSADHVVATRPAIEKLQEALGG